MDEKFKFNNLILHCFDSIDYGITIINEDGILVYGNDKYLEIFGVEKSEFSKYLGTNFENLFNGDSLLYKVLKTGNNYIDFTYCLRINDSKIYLTSSAYPIYDDKDRIIGAIDFFRKYENESNEKNTINSPLYQFENILGNSNSIKETIKMAQLYANYDENILLEGESGTGKELFAQSIHNSSKRRDFPFVAINCANLPETLIDSELFGYEEGAFTGANKGGKLGKFELANGGTIFLDEIGELPLNLQAKLLRVIENKTVTRIGGNINIKANIRVIAATNRDLEQMVEKGKFRRDLYFRLKVLYLHIPTLKDRINDIEILSNHFINKYNNHYGKRITKLNSKVIDILKKQEWTGNIRELENIISRLVIISKGNKITLSDLKNIGLKIDQNKQKSHIKLADYNKKVVEDTLKQTNGNKKKAAEILGISRTTIYRILEK